jgi:hypothetical protein
LGGIGEEREEAGSLAPLGMTTRKAKATTKATTTATATATAKAKAKAKAKADSLRE